MCVKNYSRKVPVLTELQKTNMNNKLKLKSDVGNVIPFPDNQEAP